MNKQEIDDMMKDLPSQQLPDETLTNKVIVAIIFLLITAAMCWVPDFEQDCFDLYNQRVSCESIAK